MRANRTPKDGLVVDYRKWPGLCSRPGDWLAPERFAPRPDLYFDQSKTELAEVGYRFTIPPQFADRDLEAFVRDIEALIRDTQRATCATLAAERRSFLGVNGVLAADPFDAPKSVRPKGGLKPCLAAGGHHEVMIEAKRALRYFRQRYRFFFACRSQTGNLGSFLALAPVDTTALLAATA
jgi:hypothetical protein